MVKRQGLVREIGSYLKANKKWWLLPFIIVIALLAGLILFSATPVAPFIYTLF